MSVLNNFKLTITAIINESLVSGIVLTPFRQAIVLPLLKLYNNLFILKEREKSPAKVEMCLRTISLSPTYTCSVFLVCLKRRSQAPSQRLHGGVFSQTGKRKSDDDKDWKGHLAKDKVGFWLCVIMWVMLSSF